MAKRGIIGAVALLSAGEAAASGGLWCEAQDKAVRIAINGGVTHGMGGPLFSFAGDVEATDPSVPRDLRKTVFERDHVPQYWLDGKEMRLLLYRERAADKAHGYVELTVMAKASNESSYSGRYELQLFDAESGPEGKTWNFQGAITCGAE